MKWKLKHSADSDRTFNVQLDRESMDKVRRLNKGLKDKDENKIIFLALSALEEKISRIKKRQMKKRIVKLATKEDLKKKIPD